MRVSDIMTHPVITDIGTTIAAATALMIGYRISALSAAAWQNRTLPPCGDEPVPGGLAWQMLG